VDFAFDLSARLRRAFTVFMCLPLASLASSKKGSIFDACANAANSIIGVLDFGGCLITSLIRDLHSSKMWEMISVRPNLASSASFRS
jgi:hypothetical protein